MEHKNGNDNKFDHDTQDFESMLEERTNAWQKDQSVSEIMDSLKTTKVVSEAKLERKLAEVEKEAAQQVAQTEDVVSAADESSASTESTGTLDSEVPEQSTDAPDAAETVSERKQRISLTTHVEHEVHSDPEFSRRIIEERHERTVLRGSSQPPWAHQYLASETISESQTLENIGQPVLADFWRRMIKAASRNGRDLEAVAKQIERMEQAAFWQSWAKKAYKAYFDNIIETGTAEERKRAEVAYSKLMLNKKRQVTADGQKQSRGAKAPKDPDAPRKPTKKDTEFLKMTKDGIDACIQVNMKQDMIIERMKHSGKLNQAALDYIRENAKK
jgi:hypothetical protein